MVGMVGGVTAHSILYGGACGACTSLTASATLSVVRAELKQAVFPRIQNLS
jgi:Fe-S cluster biogenesis protein NfuA